MTDTASDTDPSHSTGTGPQLVYRHSDGRTFTAVDLIPVGADYIAPDDVFALREKRICKALLQHALDLLNGEDTF